MSTEQSSVETTELLPQPIVAGPGMEFRIRHLAVALLLLGVAGWCVYDGYHRMPKANAEAIARGVKPPHEGWDVPVNRGAPFVLIPLGLYLGIRCLRLSRGSYRLENDTLRVPGHPPIPLQDIDAMDMEQWDRKGIAQVAYTVNGQSGSVTLDDFHYKREPTDAIVEHIKRHLAQDEAGPDGQNASAD